MNWLLKNNLEKEIVQRVPSINGTINLTHHMPHMQVVWSESIHYHSKSANDGSARSKQSSLTLKDFLQKGLNQILMSSNVVMHFRIHPIAVTAFIGKDFLMIWIEQSDQDMLRFLLFSDPFNVAG